MKFSCSREAMANAFQLVAGVVPQRSLKPILTRAKVTVNKKSISVEGTDLEVSLRCKFTPTSVDEEGNVAIPAEKLAAIAKEASDEEIRVESEGDVVSVFCSDGRYKVLGQSIDNFPAIPQFEKESITLSGPLLGDMVHKTAFAAAEERSRYSLNGV